MPLKDIVEQTADRPITLPLLISDLQRLGVRNGMNLLVHSSLRKLGWVNGGAHAVVLALEEVLGEQGTLIMPSQSTDYSDPANWCNPPIPEAWWEDVRRTMPAFDAELTPCSGMGAIPETFRKKKGTLRSSHPHHSFVARGANARAIIEPHPLDDSFGEPSPLSRMADLGSWVLLLGVGHDSNTSLHLSEYRADYPSKAYIRSGAPVVLNGRREWVTFRHLDYSIDDFIELGQAFAAETGLVKSGKVGQAEAMLMPQKELVAFGAEWMTENRN